MRQCLSLAWLRDRLQSFSVFDPCFHRGNILAFLAVVWIGGCGGDKLARYRVSGKVTFQGQPVQRGEITFEDPNTGQANSSALRSGGGYSLELPAGDFKVSVAPPLVQTKGTGETPPDMVPDPAVKNIPKKYWRQETSGLSAQVVKDKTTFTFDLKP
jgi:hypothetical protein